MISDTIQPLGELKIVLRDKDGNIKDQRTVPNLVVNTGKNLIARRLGGIVTGTSATPSHMSVGMSTQVAAVGDTTLVSPVAGSITALSLPSVTSNIVSMTATFGPGIGTGALTEAGIFNASSAGVMLCRTVFAVVNKDTSDTLTINWNITIA